MILTKQDKYTLSKIITAYEEAHAELSDNEDACYQQVLHLEQVVSALQGLVDTSRPLLSVGA